MKKENSYLVYAGPSMIDGAPIVGIATGFKTPKNSKTGDLVSIWIMRKDIHPQDCSDSGEDYSICGDCPFRKACSPNKKRACYVDLRPVFTMYKKLTTTGYPPLPSWDMLQDQGCRVGAYGDPAALPMKLLRKIKKHADFTLAYTHSARMFPKLKDFCLASCQDQNSYVVAKSLGFKTFRVRPSNDDTRYPLEVECLNIKRGLTCAECKLCQPGKGPDVTLQVHGLQQKIDEFNSRFSCQL